MSGSMAKMWLRSTQKLYYRRVGQNKKKYFFSLRKSVLCVHLTVFRWYIRLSGGQGVDTFSVFGGRLGHFITPLVKTQTARDLVIFKIFNLCYTPI
jgi:hypothetical protein